MGQEFGQAGLGNTSVPCGNDRGVQLVDGLVWRGQGSFMPMSRALQEMAGGLDSAGMVN